MEFGNASAALLPSVPPVKAHRLQTVRDVLRRAEPVAAAGGGRIPLGIAAIDDALAGGLMRGVLHEIAAPSEPALAAATGFALAVAALATRIASQPIVWIAEDMALLENGVTHATGLDVFGLAPERLIQVTAPKPRDALWALEEALRCRAVGAVMGEIRGSERGIDHVALRRLSLAAATHGAPVLLLRTAPPDEASPAATRWIVGPARSAAAHGPGPPAFALRLVRNRRGPLGAWKVEFSSDQRFTLASAHPEPVARTVFYRPARATRVA
jgi:protein ImuA